MAKTLPGTTIAVDWNRPEEAETLLNSLFLAGGLMLSQVASLTGLEPYVIQNWVRRGFVSPPERKRYSRRQFSRIVLINMLKDSVILKPISFLKGRNVCSSLCCMAGTACRTKPPNFCTITQSCTKSKRSICVTILSIQQR